MPIEKLYALYNLVIKEDKITDTNLNAVGFNEFDISILLDIDIIKKNPDGSYEFLDIESLFLYGKRLVYTQTYHKAEKCFLKCHELAPEHIPTIIQLFITYLKKRKYTKAFDYFTKLYIGITDPYLKKDYNFYLFLFSKLIDLPQEYQDILNSLQEDDYLIIASDQRYANKDVINTIRKKALNNDLLDADAIIYEEIVQGRIDNQDISGIMLKMINERYQKSINYIHSIIKAGNFGIAIEEYEKLGKIFNLDKDEKYIWQLLIDLLDIKKMQVVPEIKNSISSDFYTAIDNFDYSSSLKFLTETVFSKGAIFRFLVNEILQVIDDINSKTIQESNPYIPDAQKIIEKNKKELIERGIVILNPMQPDFIATLDYCISETDDIVLEIMKASEIGKKDIPYLRYVSVDEPTESYKDIKRSAYNLYYNQEYGKCIPKLRLLIQSRYPTIKDYVLLGLSYLRTNNIYYAMDYLQIATYKSFKVDSRYDFTNLINRLKGKPVSEEKDEGNDKVYVKFAESEFADKKENISTNLEKVIKLMQEGLDVLDACLKLHLSIEEILTIYLEFAKEYYKIGNIMLGDYYLKAVEQSKNKTPKIKEELAHMQRNKKLIMNKGIPENSFVNNLKRVKPKKPEF